MLFTYVILLKVEKNNSSVLASIIVPFNCNRLYELAQNYGFYRSPATEAIDTAQAVSAAPPQHVSIPRQQNTCCNK